MKGVKKCFGFLLLFVPLALSLLISSDTSALKYDVGYIPFEVPMFNMDLTNTTIAGDIKSTRSQWGGSFGFSYPVDLDYNFSSSNHPWVYNMFYSSDGNKCKYHDDSTAIFDDVYITSSSETSVSYDFYIPYYEERLNYYVDDHTSSMTSLIDIAKCNRIGQINNIDTSSYPSYTFGRPNFASYNPYRYNYNGLYVKDVDNSDGLNARARLNFVDLFENENIPSKFHSIHLPLGLFTDSSSIHNGTTLNLQAELMFDSDNPNTDTFSLNNDMQVSFGYAGTINRGSGDQNFNQSLRSAMTSCSYRLVDNRADQTIYPWSLYINCELTSAHDFSNGLVRFYLDLSLPQHLRTSSNSIWIYPMTDFVFSDLSVITNGDYTPAGYDFSYHTVLGNESSSAPGSAKVTVGDVVSGGVNWTESLKHLFAFLFINPFLPLFSMFSSSDQCASIPTIAGMIHSNETQVCPWFPSSVRSIVTPVLSISSMMLLFGFAVHWLRSSSGNLFEDSDSHESSGLSIHKKGGH